MRATIMFGAGVPHYAMTPASEPAFYNNVTVSGGLKEEGFRSGNEGGACANHFAISSSCGRAIRSRT